MLIDTDAEILRLRTVLRDLVALSAIPAAWIGREPPAVATGLADALIGLLQLDFAFVRLRDPSGAPGQSTSRRGTGGRRFRSGWNVASPPASSSPVSRSFPTSAASS